MKTKSILAIVTGLVVLTVFMTARIFRSGNGYTASTSPPAYFLPKTYTVLPSETDGASNDCHGNATGIGCDIRWPKDPVSGAEDAINVEHRFYLPPVSTDTSKLLVFLGGGNGGSKGGEYIGPVAAQQGYHVISLTYPAARANGPCAEDNLTTQEKLECYGNAFREVVTGKDAGSAPGADVTAVSTHPQDCIVNRLVKALEWAAAKYPDDGWGRYLTDTGEVDWTKVHLAGMSNGSSHVSFMGTLDEFRDVGRIALFAGPDDGEGDTTEATWNPATYIQEAEVATGSRYYGLVHYLNKAKSYHDPVFYKVTKNWLTFGMEGPLNADRFYFDPTPGVTPDFGASHMLISIDPDTDYREAHKSVGVDRYCIEYIDEECKEWGNEPIGYEAAWRYILGTGAGD